MPEGWEIRRREASFRGLRFTIQGSRRIGGRRQDVHEFQGRDVGFVRDLGGKLRRFTVRGVFIGADHDLEAARFERAFNESGAGELVLPHSPPINVSVGDYAISEPEGEARIQRFEFEAIQAGTPTVPTARPDTVGNVSDAHEAAVEAISDQFTDAFSIAGQAQAAVDTAVTISQSGATQIREVFEDVKATASTVDDEIISVAADVVASLERGISSQLLAPETGAASIAAALDAIIELPTDAAGLFNSLRGMIDFGADLVDPGSDTFGTGVLQANQNALTALYRDLVTAARAKASSRVQFESSSDAAAVRDELAAEIEARIEAADLVFDDTGAQALRKLRTQTVRDLDARAAKLPARLVYTVPRAVPALVLSQRLYGTPDREAELVSRNRSLIRNPGQVPEGAQLEVLSSV